MGNSVSLVCCQDELVKQRVEVLVIKEDGDSLRFKDGTLVRDILSAYPYHKIIRCCSQRTVLPGDAQVSCNALYFLLPVGLAVSEAVYRSLVQSVASRNLITKRTFKIDESNQHGNENGYGSAKQDHRRDTGSNNELSCNYKWKPHLRTIPEIASPSA
ncbi:hypothetical protein Tco_0713898 [Tanacetum coccineum]